MGTYRVIGKASVEKDARRIPDKTLDRIFTAIEGLADEPLPPRVTKLEGSEKTFRIRIGDYRVGGKFTRSYK